MSQKPIILVTGATGAQGGSVARALLQGKKFAVRILTRNPQSDKAITLQEAGAEIVQGDLNDIESLKQAMQGCYGVFGVTNFWEHFEHEYQQGKNLVEAVQQSNISHFVFSTLADYYKLSGNTLSVPHYDLKAALEDYCRDLQLKATFIHMAFYYENFLGFFPLQADGNGGFYFGFPQGDTKFAMVSVEDAGGLVATIFDHPDEYMGRAVGVVGAERTCKEYAEMMSRILQQRIAYKYIPRAEYAAYGFPGADDLANMFEVQRLYIPGYQLDMIESYGLNPAMQTFEQWLENNKEKFATFFQAQLQETSM